MSTKIEKVYEDAEPGEFAGPSIVETIEETLDEVMDFLDDEPTGPILDRAGERGWMGTCAYDESVRPRIRLHRGKG